LQDIAVTPKPKQAGGMTDWQPAPKGCKLELQHTSAWHQLQTQSSKPKGQQVGLMA
jgi:hypothetical protein